MSDKIFEGTERLKSSDTMLSFDGCPNKCRDGYYVDPYLHKRVRCQHCLDLRKKFVQEKATLDSGVGIGEVLNLQPSFTGYGNFEASTLLPRYELNRIEPWSADFVFSVLEHLLARVSIGEPVATSLLINLGKSAHTQNFISPFLVRSYLSGLTTAPFLRSMDILRLRQCVCNDMILDSRKSADRGKTPTSFEDVLTVDTCLVYIDAGAWSRGEHELMAVKGLMQLRAWNEKSTIILTDYYSKELFELVSETHTPELSGVQGNTAKQFSDAVNQLIDGTSGVIRDLAVYVGVRYKKGVEKAVKEQRGSSELSSSEFDKLVNGTSGNFGVGR